MNREYVIECFLSVSDEAMEKLSSKYVPENMEKMTKWTINTFLHGEMHSMRCFPADKCPLDHMFKKCEAGWLGKQVAGAI